MQDPSRYLRVEGAPRQRGCTHGHALADPVQALQRMRAPARDAWLDTARRFVDPLQRHAPRTWQEILGLAEGADLPLDDLLLINTLYEFNKHQRSPFSNCTGFAVDAGSRVICGQNNDELPANWLSGDADVVIHHVDNDHQALIYTHAGIAAYMGMNQAGLCMLWMGIDDGTRDLGVPTAAVIRETLYCSDIDAAVDFIRSIPHALPNNFLLAQPGRDVCSIEVTPNRCMVTRDAAAVCHANNFIDPRFDGEDVLKSLPIDTSCERQARMQALLREHGDDLDIEAAMNILADHHHAPRSICVHPSDHSPAATLAAMVFDPQARAMHIAFGNPCATPWSTYRLTQ